MIGDTFVVDGVAHPFNMRAGDLLFRMEDNPLPAFTRDERFVLTNYGTVDTLVTDDAIADLERQVRDLRIDGLKVYPAIRREGRMTSRPSCTSSP